MDRTIGCHRENSALDEVIDRAHRIRRRDRGYGNPQRRGKFDDVLGLLSCRPLVHGRQELLASTDAAGEGRQLRVIEEFGAVDEDQEVLKLLRCDRAEAHQAVGRRHNRRQFDTSSADRCVVTEHAVRHRPQRSHRNHHRLIDGDVNDLTPAGAAGMTGTRRGRDGGKRPRHPLTDAAARL